MSDLNHKLVFADEQQKVHLGKLSVTITKDDGMIVRQSAAERERTGCEAFVIIHSRFAHSLREYGIGTHSRERVRPFARPIALRAILHERTRCFHSQQGCNIAAGFSA